MSFLPLCGYPQVESSFPSQTGERRISRVAHSNSDCSPRVIGGRKEGQRKGRETGREIWFLRRSEWETRQNLHGTVQPPKSGSSRGGRHSRPKSKQSKVILGAIHTWYPQNFRIVWPPLSSVFGTVLYYKIHATSLTMSAFSWPPFLSSADVIYGWCLRS